MNKVCAVLGGDGTATAPGCTITAPGLRLKLTAHQARELAALVGNSVGLNCITGEQLDHLSKTWYEDSKRLVLRENARSDRRADIQVYPTGCLALDLSLVPAE